MEKSIKNWNTNHFFLGFSQEPRQGRGAQKAAFPSVWGWPGCRAQGTGGHSGCAGVEKQQDVLIIGFKSQRLTGVPATWVCQSVAQSKSHIILRTKRGRSHPIFGYPWAHSTNRVLRTTSLLGQDLSFCLRLNVVYCSWVGRALF